MASTAFSMLAKAVTITTASRGYREASVSSRLNPDSSPSFKSTNARSKWARSNCRSASGMPVASSTACFIASRAIRRVFRIFGFVVDDQDSHGCVRKEEDRARPSLWSSGELIKRGNRTPARNQPRLER